MLLKLSDFFHFLQVIHFWARYQCAVKNCCFQEWGPIEALINHAASWIWKCNWVRNRPSSLKEIGPYKWALLYRVVQLNLTPEIEVFYIFSMTSPKQHFRCKNQLDLPVQCKSDKQCVMIFVLHTTGFISRRRGRPDGQVPAVQGGHQPRPPWRIFGVRGPAGVGWSDRGWKLQVRPKRWFNWMFPGKLKYFLCCWKDLFVIAQILQFPVGNPVGPTCISFCSEDEEMTTLACMENILPGFSSITSLATRRTDTRRRWRGTWRGGRGGSWRIRKRRGSARRMRTRSMFMSQISPGRSGTLNLDCFGTRGVTIPFFMESESESNPFWNRF